MSDRNVSPLHHAVINPLISRRHALIGASLAAASAVAFARQPSKTSPRVSKSSFEKWIPAEFGPWRVVGASGVVLPPPDALSDRLYDNLVTRAYEAAGLPPVMMLLAYNNLQDGVVQVHRPEICYPVGGYELSVTRPVSILARGHRILASMFTATGVDRVEQVLYFTRLGGAYPTTWGAQRWAVIKENLRGQVPDGLLLRVSLIEQKQEAALPVLEAFTRDFIAAAPPNLQSLILA